METYVERMVEERKELKARLEKLDAFMKAEKFVSLSAAEQAAMRLQRRAMSEYLDALTVRLGLAGQSPWTKA